LPEAAEVKGIKKGCLEDGGPIFVGLEQMTSSSARNQQLEAAHSGILRSQGVHKKPVDFVEQH
jgi:hypothetical protein